MQRLNQFDRIAGIYDVIARLVFGQSIMKAQKFFLKDVPDASVVLILGGGTGWIAKELLREKPNCRIVYVEASSKMIELSRKKISPLERIDFVHGTEENIPEMKFDVVITNFFLDMFKPESLDAVVTRIRSVLKANSLWLATDFVDGQKWWQTVLLKLMYWFFRYFSRIESKALPDWSKAIENHGMKKEAMKMYYGDFIKTVKYSA
ncbi:MAG: class I SAM-dependent methyltransferase [Bacteroidetes bacterium]|nr:class I SAM-dependent methyltransferase [Bacteroidota bacterium]